MGRNLRNLRSGSRRRTRLHGVTWIERSRQRVVNAIEAGARYQESLLPVVAAMVAAELDRPVVVVDIGGGPGNAYPAVKSALPEQTRLEFHVVENERVCELGREIYEKTDAVSFYHELPKGLECDILHLGSVLQYVDDWRGLLKELAEVEAPYFLLSDVFAGDITSFVTGQHYFGSIMPCRFQNIREVISAVADNGYRLVLRTEYDRTMLGKRDPLPLDALPPQFRLRYAHHLLFRLN